MLLGNMLSQVDFPGSAELLQQVSSVNVVAGLVTMLDFQLVAPAPVSSLRDGPAPLSAIVSDAEGTSVGELLTRLSTGGRSVADLLAHSGYKRSVRMAASPACANPTSLQRRSLWLRCR
jgi:hypothetical protein